MGKIILNDVEYGIGISNGSNIDSTNLVEKDSIVTVIDENVTDEQVPSAKAVYDKLIDLPTEIPLGQQVYSNTPIGTVLSFAGLNAPNGYLLCDGSSYAVADYQDLYDVIGNTYGGDAEYFNVPNLIDKFIQGSNTSGTEKEAGLPNIEGESAFRPISDSSSVMTNLNTGVFSESNQYVKISNSKFYSCGTGSQYDAGGILNFNAHLSNSIYGNSDTVQPPALTMVYIIKAFYTNEGVDAPVKLEDNVIDYIDNLVDNKTTELDNKVEELDNKFTEQITEQISEGISRSLLVGKEVPTPETCPLGSWYVMYY